MAKRGQNEGSIYKRKDGRWTAVINLGYKSGKLQRKVFYGKTREDVRRQLNKALNDHEQGLPINVERQTVAQFLEHWLKDTVIRTVRTRTHAGYSQTVNLHIIPQIGKILLTKLSPQHVQTMLNALADNGLGARTVAYTRTVLRAALNQAVKWSLIVRNPAALVDPPRYKRPEVTPFTPEEARLLIIYIQGNRLEAFYQLTLALGLRAGEALGLRWQDIDLNNRTLKVSFTLSRITGKGMVLGEPKTDRSRRTLPIPETIALSLRAHRVRQLEEKLAAGENWQDTGMVFTTPIGTPLDPSNMIRQFKEILTAAGLPKKRLHDLRHSCASFLLAQGVPARTVMEILGHSQISLTMDTYTHVMPQQKREAADLLESFLFDSNVDSNPDSRAGGKQ